MNKGVLKIILKLSFILLLTGTLVVYCEIQLRKIPNIYTVKKEIFERQLDSIQVLILGNSQSQYDIDPDYFSSGSSKIKGFNLAYPSQSLYYDKELTFRYLDRIPKLKVVIISVSYFSLWSELYSAVESWRDAGYMFWNIKSNDPRFFDIRRSSYIALYGIDYAQDLLRRNFKNVYVDYPAVNGHGIEHLHHGIVLTVDAGKVRVKTHNDMMHYELINNNIDYMQSLITELKSRNIFTAIITTPVYKTYYENIDVKKEEINEDILNKLSVKNNVRYFNYLRDNRFDSTDFMNNDHLDNKGIEKFSKILNEDIIKSSNVFTGN